MPNPWYFGDVYTITLDFFGVIPDFCNTINNNYDIIFSHDPLLRHDSFIRYSNIFIKATTNVCNAFFDVERS